MTALPLDLLRQIRRLHLRARRIVRTSLGGEYQSAFKGSGLSFDDVREYQPGDDVRRIDWNVTARVGAPFVKRYVEERELTVLLVVDVSAGMRFGSTGILKRTVAAEVAAVLALCAAGHNDRVGFLAYSDRIERTVRPGKGGRHVLSVLRDALFFSPDGTRTDPTTAWETLNAVYRRRAIVFLVGDFRGPIPADLLRRTAARHETIAVRIADPLELAWPAAGLVRLRDAETGRERLIDSSSPAFRRAFADRASDERRTFHDLCRQSQIDLLDLDTTGTHFDRLLEYFRARRRRER
jgi:uncharacterized protein (DUF58 family)